MAKIEWIKCERIMLRKPIQHQFIKERSLKSEIKIHIASVHEEKKTFKCDKSVS